MTSAISFSARLPGEPGQLVYPPRKGTTRSVRTQASPYSKKALSVLTQLGEVVARSCRARGQGETSPTVLGRFDRTIRGLHKRAAGMGIPMTEEFSARHAEAIRKGVRQTF